MRVAAAVLALVLLPAQAAFAGAQNSGNNGASNDGNTVSVSASHAATSGGGGSGGRGGRSQPAVDYAARYDALYDEMMGERSRELGRRLAEAATYRRFANARDDCATQAAYHEERGLRRVLVTRRVQVTEVLYAPTLVPRQVTVRVPHTFMEWVPVVEHYWVWVKRWWARVPERRSRVRWVQQPRTVWREETRIVWHTELRAIPRTVWKNVEEWQWVGNAAHTSAAGVYRACENAYNHALAAHQRTTSGRRDVWFDRWSAMNEETHDAWVAFNTTCQTIRRVSNVNIQECSYGEWRDFDPGAFERELAGGPAPPPQQVVQQARDQITPPGPRVHLSPRVEWEQIVHLPTWMWIETGAWAPVTARADAGQVWAEATATPARVTWDMGNGDQVVCEGPGTPYDEGRPEAQQQTGCSYTYRQSSAGQPNDAYTVTATLTYDVTWEGSGGAGGNLGTVSRTTSVPVRVAELQALVTAAG